MRRRERDGILMNSRLFCYFITSKGSKWGHGHEKRVYFYVSQCCSFGMSCLSLVVMRNCRSWELVFVQAIVLLTQEFSAVIVDFLFYVSE